MPLLASIDSVLYVKGLKYNLLSISQFGDNGYIVSFNKDTRVVKTDDDKDYYSQLVIYSQFKFTLSPVMVQDFLSQSICLLTNNSNCKFLFLFFLCLTYTLAQLMKRNTASITIMHSIQNQIIHQFSQKDKSFLLSCHQNQVKLFHMLQNEQTNYP